MTVTFSLWWIPGLLTAAIWATLFLWPMPRNSGYDFGGALAALFGLALALIATLLVWATAFAVAAFA